MWIYFQKAQIYILKESHKKSSFLGRILTISYAVIYAAFFVYKIIRMALKIDITFYETQNWTGEIPSLDLNNNHFYGGFALVNIFTGKPFINESIYYYYYLYISLISLI